MHTTRNRGLASCLTLLFTIVSASSASDLATAHRCQVIPLPEHQVSFRIAGVEKTRWHFGDQYPRPFFFPLRGPSGASLTRMGHPGAPNHDHHRSVWFAHNKVAGIDFWSDTTEARIQQTEWLAYEDGPDEAIMASRLIWSDVNGRQLMSQELVAAIRPLSGNEHALEVQLTLTPGKDLGSDGLQLEKTNFGLFAVRVAKTISGHFGSGTLSSSEGKTGEKEIFGKSARWMDYSGHVLVGHGEQRRVVREGVTYFDHPNNPRYPTHWHVREDGWMGASFCYRERYAVTHDTPLTLRYLLHSHSGAYDHAKAERTQRAFALRPGFFVQKSTRPHRHYEVLRKER